MWAFLFDKAVMENTDNRTLSPAQSTLYMASVPSSCVPAAGHLLLVEPCERADRLFAQVWLKESGQTTIKCHLYSVCWMIEGTDIHNCRMLEGELCCKKHILALIRLEYIRNPLLTVFLNHDIWVFFLFFFLLIHQSINHIQYLLLIVVTIKSYQHFLIHVIVI